MARKRSAKTEPRPKRMSLRISDELQRALADTASTLHQQRVAAAMQAKAMADAELIATLSKVWAAAGKEPWSGKAVVGYEVVGEQAFLNVTEPPEE